MTYERANAVYALNTYIFKALQVNLNWTTISYTNQFGQTKTAKPIIPSQQQPELLATGKSFLVYGSTIQPTTGTPGLVNEYIVYTVWSPSATEANDVADFLHDLFADRDKAPDAVNSWLDAEGGYDFNTGLNSRRDRYVSFTAIRPGLVEKAEPAEQEDGWVAAGVTIDVQYQKKNHAPVTRFTYP